MSTPAPFQRETLEFLPVTVTVNGTAVTANVEFAICDLSERPSTFGSAVTLSGDIGVMVDGTALGPGTFRVFAQINSSPEVPVIDCGSFRVI